MDRPGVNGMSQQPRAWFSRSIRSNLAWSTAQAFSKTALGVSIVGAISVSGTTVQAIEKDPQVAVALSYKPRQANVAYDQVAEKDFEKCSSKTESKNGVEGLTIYGSEGQILRRFTDVNGDRQVDQWCYYKDGIEVYRDIDSDFNKSADQYRWLGTGGMRWGIDKNEDGKIDAWKFISPEEVTIELVDAIKTKDEEKYRRLLLSDQEIKMLGLGEEKSRELQERVSNARSGFSEFVTKQNLISAKTKWAHFAADKPGVVPSGTDGATKDIIAYENVISILDNDGTTQQLMVGTLVQQGDAWKLADLPRVVTEGATVENGFFFPSAISSRTAMATGGNNGLSVEMQSLLSDLEKNDNQLKTANASKLPQLHEDRAQILVKLINATKGTNEMELWVRQFVDSVSSASMQGQYEAGLGRLREFESELSNVPGGKSLLPYVAYRLLTTEYQVKSMSEDANFAKLQAEHMENLEAYVAEYENVADATEAKVQIADAMVQIALNHELSANIKQAKEWYEKVAKRFPETMEGKKSSGAMARLSLDGRSFALAGKTLDGKSVDTKKFAGAAVIVQYWASWCEPCKADMEKLRAELARYPRDLQVVGVNLDGDPQTAINSLKPGAAPWPQIHEGNGFDSDLAVGLGVLSVPVTILIDQDGRVVHSGSHYSVEMEKKLEGILVNKKPVPARAAANPAKPPAGRPAQIGVPGNGNPQQPVNPPPKKK
jgi:thiol-disulfide isomerase/thioredoxin